MTAFSKISISNLCLEGRERRNKVSSPPSVGSPLPTTRGETAHSVGRTKTKVPPVPGERPSHPTARVGDPSCVDQCPRVFVRSGTKSTPKQKNKQNEGPNDMSHIPLLIETKGIFVNILLSPTFLQFSYTLIGVFWVSPSTYNTLYTGCSLNPQHPKQELLKTLERRVGELKSILHTLTWSTGVIQEKSGSSNAPQKVPIQDGETGRAT